VHNNDILLFCSVAIIATLVLYMVDVARGSDLNLSKAARDKLAEEESEQE